jgi:two-component system, chemotaxis family, chemotaxis protein CheY
VRRTRAQGLKVFGPAQEIVARRRCTGRFETSRPSEEAAVQSILIVEDSATMRSLIASALEHLGVPLKVDEAESGFEALRMLPRRRYDLIVTDINMPDINGLELVSFVKRNQAYRGIPLVIISTEGSQRDREKGLGLGAEAYLVKPFEPEDLVQVVRSLLGAEAR